jgi:hypothetical protein
MIREIFSLPALETFLGFFLALWAAIGAYCYASHETRHLVFKWSKIPLLSGVLAALFTFVFMFAILQFD